MMCAERQEAERFSAAPQLLEDQEGFPSQSLRNSSQVIFLLFQRNSLNVDQSLKMVIMFSTTGTVTAEQL